MCRHLALPANVVGPHLFVTTLVPGSFNRSHCALVADDWKILGTCVHSEIVSKTQQKHLTNCRQPIYPVNVEMRSTWSLTWPLGFFYR